MRTAYLLALTIAATVEAALAATPFESTVRPFVTANCAGCHNAKLSSGSLNLTQFGTTAALRDNRETWDRVLERLRTGEMPPKGAPRPSAAEIAKVTRWLEAEFARQDAAMRPDPGRVTARRLNRYEYNNTVRDLLGVDFRPADDFPADDFNYGFDNIADALSLSPMLMEKYLAAAQKIARAAIEPEPLPKKPFVSHHANLSETKVWVLRRKFAWDGDYDIRIAVPYLIEGRNDPGTLYVSLDGGAPTKHPVGTEYINEGKFTEFRTHIPAGLHEFRTWVVRDVEAAIETDWKKELDRVQRLKTSDTRPEFAGRRRDTSPPRTREEIAQKVTASRSHYVEYLDVRGPYNAKPAPLPDSYKLVFTCGHTPDAHTDVCARSAIARVAERAWRRPLHPAETAKLMSFYRLARGRGEPVDKAVEVGLKAILVSPKFLFRIESHANPTDPGTVQKLSSFELASRLSYFLWSTLPDERLMTVAKSGRLTRPEVLTAEVQRMLANPRSEALVDNFAGQWLHVRNLNTARPDPDKFRSFNEEVRDSMKQETRLFLLHLMRENRSILDMLTARYSYLNEPLAKFYGVEGVTGEEFRKVDMTSTPRVGILTHGSVLTVSSYPTRTSPVLRGKWILETLLNAPPPPPPADVPALDETGVGITGTLRQQLEKHRANPVCASCHSRMDPLGFGLESFDAVGRWRTHDGKVPVDSTGTLPNGRSFATPVELAEVLAEDKAAFTRCLTEKLMTFALGRAVIRSDKPVIDRIAKVVADNGYRFNTLIREIVMSEPFRMHRGEASRTKGGETDD